MRHLRPLNRQARQASGGEAADVHAHACSDCCTAWAPGWETGSTGHVDPCPWMSDLAMCYYTCYWAGQVADGYAEPDWLDACGNLQQDWYRICVVPD
jgi:hypothetical protein